VRKRDNKDEAPPGRQEAVGSGAADEKLSQFRAALTSVKGEKSVGGKAVKLGRPRTRLASGRAFLRLASKDPRPTAVSVKAIWQGDEVLGVLDTHKSVGDALCGDPEKGDQARGLGMRRNAKREIIVDRVNALIAIICLAEGCPEEPGLTMAEIAALVGRDSEAALAEWVAGLPERP
jgi:hypothetical protein